MKLTAIWSLHAFNTRGTGRIHEALEKKEPQSVSGLQAEQAAETEGAGVAKTWHVGLGVAGDVERIAAYQPRTVCYTRKGNRFEVTA